jgi:hypothetical protein
MRLRLPMLIMRVEEVRTRVPVLVVPHVALKGPKLIKKKFQLRDMSIDANTVSGALRYSPPRIHLRRRCDVCLQSVFEKIGDVQPKYTVNLERCDLIKVSLRAMPA